MYEMATPLIQKDVSLRQLNGETNATLYPPESPYLCKTPDPQTEITAVCATLVQKANTIRCILQVFTTRKRTVLQV
jgi:hypothetical protein